jgi:DNA-binding transcriptional LysR family regulator
MQNGGMYDWNDLRFFLAVARAGSTLGASRLMGVDQTTVARRIGSLERDLGVRLFDRRQDGYRPTEAADLLRETAERVEAEAETLGRLAAQRTRRLSGVVRVSTNEFLANLTIMPALPAFNAAYPDIQVQLVVEDRLVDVGRGEADIAVRGTVSRQSEHTAGAVARKLTDVTWSIYCSRDYAARRGAPDSEAAFAGHPVVGAEGRMAGLPGFVWLAGRTEGPVVASSSSLTNMLVAIKAGLGLGPLPCQVGDLDHDLIRCIPPPPELDSALWLLIRDDLKNEPRVRAFADFVIARVGATRDQWTRRD